MPLRANCSIRLCFAKSESRGYRYWDPLCIMEDRRCGARKKPAANGTRRNGTIRAKQTFEMRTLAPIHGANTWSERTRILNSFRNSKLKVLGPVPFPLSARHRRDPPQIKNDRFSLRMYSNYKLKKYSLFLILIGETVGLVSLAPSAKKETWMLIEALDCVYNIINGSVYGVSRIPAELNLTKPTEQQWPGQSTTGGLWRVVMCAPNYYR